MDFDTHNPDDGGDKIDLFLDTKNFNWDKSTTALEKRSADNNHPFLSEGAAYYELQVNTSTDPKVPDWHSVLNLVGVNGTEITLDRLIANGNLI